VLPQITDDKCRFTVVSYREDHIEVGELKKYRDMDVEIRGIVQPMHGRAGMGPEPREQFPRRPAEVQAGTRCWRGGFDAEQERPPVNDPNLRSRADVALYEHQGSGDAAGEVVPVTPDAGKRLQPCKTRLNSRFLRAA